MNKKTPNAQHPTPKWETKRRDTGFQIHIASEHRAELHESFSMKRRRTAQRAFVNLRASITLLVCAAAACSIVTGTLLGYFRPEAPTNGSQRTLTFADRVAYERAIEEVYWQHRIWPNANAGPKPPLDKVMSQAQIRKRWKIICATRRRWRITGKGRSLPINCKPRWSASPVTPTARGVARTFRRAGQRSVRDR